MRLGDCWRNDIKLPAGVRPVGRRLEVPQRADGSSQRSATGVRSGFDGALAVAGPAFCAKAALTSLGPSSRCGRSTEKKTDSFSSAMDSLSATIRNMHKLQARTRGVGLIFERRIPPAGVHMDVPGRPSAEQGC